MTLTLELAQALGTATKAEIEKACAPLRAELQDLKTEFAAFKANNYMNFRGTYQPGTRYSKGDTVPRNGLWTALEDTAAVPGGNDQAARSWQLSVKGPGH